jgi:hypothetical protein
MRIWVVAFIASLGSRWAETSPLPQPTPFVPASANLIVYVDWSGLLASPVLAGIETSLIDGDSWAEVEELRELSGMDPLKDVWSVVYFTTPSEDGGSGWGIAGYGAFDPERFVENVEARGKVSRARYRETTLYTLPAFGTGLGKLAGEQVLAFPDSTTVLFGAPAQVRAMLDAGSGFAPAASDAGELAGALEEFTAAEAFWAVGAGDGGLASRARGAGAKGLSNVPPLVSFSLSARFGAKVKVRARAETSDSEAAKSLAEVVRGIAAMGALGRPADESLQEVLESLEVETIDERVDLSFEVDEDTVRDYLRAQESEDRKPRAREQ